MYKSAEDATEQLNQLLKSYEGTNVVIPSVEDLSPVWKLEVNPHLESCREEYNAWVEHWFEDAKIRDKVAAVNADGFAAMSYPRCDREKCLNLSKLLAWYFPWDDVIDDAAMKQQPLNIKRYRDETIDFVQQSLLTDRKTPSYVHPNPVIMSFWDIGVAIREKGTPTSNKRFSEQQCLFISSSAQSQLERKEDEPVTIEQYLRRREDNIAIHPLIELGSYAYGSELPAYITHENNEAMSRMWRDIAWMGIIANDLLSLRRELIHGQFENIVPLLMYHQNLDIQKAIDKAYEMIHDCYRRFYKDEQDLHKQIKPEDLEVVESHLQVFKDIVMCNLHWSYGLKRYMKEEHVQANGTVVFDIRLPLL